MPTELRVQTVVALVKAAHEKVEQLGKTQFQKLIYFLQEVGVPLGYKYQIYHYGPYSFELSDEMSSLDSLGVLSVTTDPSGYGFHVEVGSHAGQYDIPKDYRSQLEFVVGALGGEKPASLEVKATLHFVNKVLSKQGSNSPEQVIGKVRELKPHFSETYVTKCYEELKTINLI